MLRYVDRQSKTNYGPRETNIEMFPQNSRNDEKKKGGKKYQKHGPLRALDCRLGIVIVFLYFCILYID